MTEDDIAEKLAESGEIYKKVIEKFGETAQMTKAMEECGELITAICKYQLNEVSGRKVIDEIADVYIMCDQLAIIFGREAVVKRCGEKLTRLRGMLGDG